MKSSQGIRDKMYTIDALARRCNILRMQEKKIVFTNGVFDIIHGGHIASLTEAASHGDFLIVGVNADISVKKLKGPTRPLNDEASRMQLLASLVQTDAVILFEEDTPLELIKRLLPDVLVKGGDYTVDQVAGAKEVIAAGGEVIIAGMIEGLSTTGLMEKMKIPN